MRARVASLFTPFHPDSEPATAPTSPIPDLSFIHGLLKAFGLAAESFFWFCRDEAVCPAELLLRAAPEPAEAL